MAYIIDTPRTASPATFVSNMLYACSILFKIKLPMILVFNKEDVKSSDFAQQWMTDFDTFQDALVEDEERAESEGRTSYATDLQRSMGLVFQEFYEHLSLVGVSSRLGTGMKGFFKAIQDKKEEFKQDYQPEMDRQKQLREEENAKKRQEELGKMMQGMAVDGAKSKDDMGLIEKTGADSPPR